MRLEENEKIGKFGAWCQRKRLFLGLGIGFLLVVGVGVASVFAIDSYFSGKTLPNQYFAGEVIGGVSPERAAELLTRRMSELENLELQFNYGEASALISASELGLTWLNDETINSQLRVHQAGENVGQLLLALVDKSYVPLRIRTDREQIEYTIYDQLDGVARKKNAYFTHDEAGLLVTAPAQIGNEVVWESLYDDLIAALATIKPDVITVTTTTVEPTITADDLTAVKDQFMAAVGQPLTLTGDAEKWTLNWLDKPEWLVFERTEADSDDGFPYVIGVDPDQWQEFVATELAPKLEWEASNVRLDLNHDTGLVEFTGSAQDGQRILREQLLAMVGDTFMQSANAGQSVAIPLETVAGDLTVDEDLQAMGIYGLVASGHTSYYGSPANRMHNISVGLSKFDGMIIQPGETFSFNDNLGPVEGYTGYLPELVIKPEGTIPEYGGGLCQVSTTMYRAVLNADLPVKERNPHSYAVSYYAQQLGHGLDATIYPGASDLKFENTTGAAIVLHSYSEGANAYFKFYGTPIDIQVSYDGPYISNQRGAPAAIEIADSKLAPGTRKQVEKAHAGFDVLWYKIVTYADGHSEKKEIFSRYKAIPAKFLVGPNVATSSQADLDAAFGGSEFSS